MGNGTLARASPVSKYITTPVRALFLNYSPWVFGIRLSINSSLPSPPCRRRSFLLPNDPQIRPGTNTSSHPSPSPYRPRSRFIGESVLHDFSFRPTSPSRFEDPGPQSYPEIKSYASPWRAKRLIAFESKRNFPPHPLFALLDTSTRRIIIAAPFPR